MYKEFLIIFIIIIFHEFGHLLVSKIYNWNLDKIEIYPFGGCVKFNEKLNRPLKEELFILLGGPLFQIILFLIITIIYKNNYLSYRNYLLFKNYHYTLLTFNLLPIYPLDGGRIINCFINFLLPYKLGNKLTIIISIITMFLVLFFYKSTNYLLMVLILITELIIYFKRQEYLLNKLLLERYLYDYRFSIRKVINDTNNFYKERNHLIKINNRYYTEKEYLNKRFGGLK